MIDVYVGTHEVDTFWMVEIDNRWYIRDTSYYCRNMPRQLCCYNKSRRTKRSQNGGLRSLV